MDRESLDNQLALTAAMHRESLDAQSHTTIHNDGRRIGPYLLVKKLGQGGMGSVWLAEQSEPVHRSVALKLISAGMDSAEVIARFASERQALALMQHPAIAQVYDAGSTPEGSPYFVMEHIDGVSITEYCDRHQLTIRQRLELFITVCEGVQHAHQKAILHRDLKPSNVLVTERDGKPIVKIIDFGLAKAVGSTPAQMAGATQFGVVVGTPQYMSPEQMDFSAEGVDTRTDVYSLGVVLYELLTGTTPHSDTAAFDEMLSHIRQGDVSPPSNRFANPGSASGQSAKNWSANPETLRRQLAGDLDWITLKALANDREQRYSSASEFAADILRHLRDEPVLARRPSTSYRVRKFVRRNRLPVGFAALAALLVVCLAVAMTVQAVRIAKERDRANQEAETTRRISEFLTQMFKVSDPSEARGNSVTAREILDKASREIEGNLGQSPEVRAQLMYAMGDTYFGLGLYDRSEQLLQRAIEGQTRALGSDHARTLRSRSRLGSALWSQGRFAESEKVLRSTLESQRRVVGPEHPDTLQTMNLLAEALNRQGRFAETEKVLRETIRVQSLLLGAEAGPTLRSERSLGTTLYEQRKYTEAEAQIRKTIQTQRRVLGPEHPGTLYSMNSLALILNGLGRYSESEKLHRETLEIQRRVLGPDHPNTHGSLSNLAAAIQSQRRISEALPLYLQAVEGRKRTLGPNHPDTLNVERTLATALADQKQYAEAEEIFRRAFEKRQQIFGPDHHQVIDDLCDLAITLSHMGRHVEAERMFQDTLERAERSEGKQTRPAAYFRYASGSVLAGRLQQGLELLEKSVDLGLDPLVYDLTKVDDLETLRGDSRFEKLVARMRLERDKAAAK